MITFLRLTVLIPISFLFAILAELRRVLYSFIFKPKKLKPVIISVGNLTSGGTGKTPFVLEMLSKLGPTGKKIVVVSRSYKSKLNTIGRVELVPNASVVFGDEPSLIAQKFPQIPVYVGPNKLQTCLEVERIENPDIILVDDGFQHLRLHRDVDIVLIDVTEPRWHYLPLPSGYARDALWQLDRAAIIVLTKENLAGPGRREFARALVESHKNIIGMDYKMGTLARVCDEQTLPVEFLRDQKLLLVSGIGRPKTFHALISVDYESQIVGQIDYKDHHPYNESDIQKIIKTAESVGATTVLVTEKDAVKLKSLIGQRHDFVTVLLETQVKGLDAALKKEGIL